MEGGFTILPKWLISAFPSLKPRRRQLIHDPYDHNLPPPRPRPNRLPITWPSTPQPHSHLLELPLEIRRQIWSYVLKYHTIHVDFDMFTTRLRCNHCMSPDPSKCNHGHCAARVKSSEVPPKLLCLLQACRQVYTEAIDILYSSNTFVVSNPAVIEYLPLSLQPQSLNTIRTLRFVWELLGNTVPPTVIHDYPQSLLHIQVMHQEKWRKIWDIISAMEGLHELHVKLFVCDYTWANLNKDAAAYLLEPVKQVTRPELFTITLPFPPMYEGMPPEVRGSWRALNGWEGSDPWDDLPNCTIQRISSSEIFS
ncbi:hypothetical protein BKA61DRAFT_288403 [Leptodontidium sp. MPI-SDFR-AT-0119]|nr:hypothetical protein BKA61DRAFT_288403 [Leptodontidium sp. MPI-SDFR-AT-0119]